MILKIASTNRFDKDFKLMLKRGKDRKKLDILVTLIAEGVKQGVEHHLILPSKYCLHRLSGSYLGFWECHIEPDWLLLYYLEGYLLRLERTGGHSDLFH